MERMWTLDGLRGLAAVSVAIYHGLYWHSDILINSAGKYSVYLFFMLSSMTLIKVYDGRFAESITAKSLTEFYRNRIARIIPLLALISALSFAFAMVVGGAILVEGSKALLTATGAFALGSAGNLSNTIGAWSLGIEFFFYLIFPVIALLVSSSTVVVLIIAAVGLNLAQFVHNVFIFATFSDQAYWPHYIMPLSFVGYFAWGVVLARLPCYPLKCGWIGVIGVLTLIWVSLFGVQSNPVLLAFPGAILTPVLLAGFTYLVYAWDYPSLLVPAFKILGEISYSVYLVHPLVYFGLTRTVWPADEGSVVGFVAVFVPLSMCVAWLTHRYFERPMRRRLRTPRAPGPINSKSAKVTC